MLVDHLLKAKREYRNWKKRDSKHIYQNELVKTCFQLDLTYKGLKDLIRKTV